MSCSSNFSSEWGLQLRLSRPFTVICLIGKGPEKFLYLLNVCLHVFTHARTHVYMYPHKHALTQSYKYIYVHMQRDRLKTMSDVEYYPLFRTIYTIYTIHIETQL